MIIPAKNVEDYLKKLSEDKKEGFIKLRETIAKNIPKGFEEQMIYGMVGYVVPLKTYPDGYHCDPSIPLSFISIACQKNFIALYHMGVYSSPELLEWFTEEYKKQVPTKLDMGKSCIRFKKPNEIPFKLIAELCKKMSMKEWVERYEEILSKTAKGKEILKARAKK